MSINEEELHKLENKINTLKEKKIRTEEQLKSLRQRKDTVVEELSKLGVAPQELSQIITDLQQQIHTELENISAQIPESFR